MLTIIIQFKKKKREIQIKHMAIVNIYQITSNRNVQFKGKKLNFLLDLQCTNPQ